MGEEEDKFLNGELEEEEDLPTLAPENDTE